MEYIYRGDKLTAPELKGQHCKAVRRADGKCIRGRSKILVEFQNGERHVVLAYHLRKIKSDIVTIPLSNGVPALVDSIDADLVQFNWHCVDGYAVRNGKRFGKRSENKRTPAIRMHRLIMERILQRPLLKHEEVDHIHGNKADNRRSELRLANKIQNQQNKKTSGRNTSGFKGVDWSKQRGKWRARICVNKKSVHLGFFDTPEEGYAAYCAAADSYFGDFANYGITRK